MAEIIESVEFAPVKCAMCGVTIEESWVRLLRVEHFCMSHEGQIPDWRARAEAAEKRAADLERVGRMLTETCIAQEESLRMGRIAREKAAQGLLDERDCYLRSRDHLELHADKLRPVALEVARTLGLDEEQK